MKAANTVNEQEQKAQGSDSELISRELFDTSAYSAPQTPPKRANRARPADQWSLQVSLPMVREPMHTPEGNAVAVRTPQSIAELCADLGHAAQEAFVVIDLNAKNNVIDKRLVSLGILDGSLVHPREVFRGAIVSAAAALVCAHNHPSGDPTPSAEDLRITRQLVEAGKVLSIRVLDHVIIGRADATAPGSPAFVSLRESGMVSFQP